MRFVIALELDLRGYQTFIPFPHYVRLPVAFHLSSFIPLEQRPSVVTFTPAKIKQKAQTCKRFAPMGVNYGSCANAQRFPSNNRIKLSGFISQSKSTGVGRSFERPLQKGERMAL